MMSMSTTHRTATTYSVTIAGHRAALVIDASTARVEVEGESARFIAVAAVANTGISDVDGRYLVQCGQAVAVIPTAAARMLSTRFGLPIYRQGEVVAVR